MYPTQLYAGISDFDGTIKVLRIDGSYRAFYYDVAFFLENPQLIMFASVNHRLYPLLGSLPPDSISLPSSKKITRRYLFFQNWYSYQDEIIMSGGTFDLIQVINMFNADSSIRLAQVVGIVIGRWIGGLLGY
ncbi:hypothetical protein BGZ60DRAFT_473920 [Tricladium varicosporioides]|nr:hypothetical protein BGZ60DRAFT_473920 [Hymenoscyphus varicosporioides]